jgi:hypothetical protein
MRIEEVLLDPHAVEAELLATFAETTQDRPRHLTPELRQAQPDLHCGAAYDSAQVAVHGRCGPVAGPLVGFAGAATVVRCTPSSPV